VQVTLSVRADAMTVTQPQATDNNPLPHRRRNLPPLTGLTSGQAHIICAPTRHRLPRRPRRPWGLPLPVRVLLVVVHLRTTLTTRALAALFGISQSALDRIIHHLVPVLAHSLTRIPDEHHGPWIINGTLIPVHDQSITAPAKNHRRPINTQIIVSSHTRAVVTVGASWTGNRNDVVVARHTVAHLLTGDPEILGDGGYRGINTITTPRRDRTGRILRDQHWPEHRRIRARVEHVIAQLKDWQILRQCRRPGDAINHSLQIIAAIWNIKIRNQLRVTS
jgi:hypothetical protein